MCSGKDHKIGTKTEKKRNQTQTFFTLLKEKQPSNCNKPGIVLSQPWAQLWASSLLSMGLTTAPSQDYWNIPAPTHGSDLLLFGRCSLPGSLFPLFRFAEFGGWEYCGTRKGASGEVSTLYKL